METRKKELVRIYARKLANGDKSLHLVIHANGKRSYEFLRLYLCEEKTRADRERNKQTMRLAEAIKAKRIVEIQNHEYGFREDGGKELLFPFIDEYSGSLSKSVRARYAIMKSCIDKYTKGRGGFLTLGDVTDGWVKGYYNFLLNQGGAEKSALRHNTIRVYMSDFRAVMNKAYREGKIQRNPLLSVSNIPKEDTERCYLTLDELRLFIRTCKINPVGKRAYLFSALTGIRWSDIEQLRWRQVAEYEGMTRITFTQQKTKGLMYLDISPEAEQYLGERGAEDEKVFAGLPTLSAVNIGLKNWSRKSGIGKRVSFHTARHTFATMMLNLGTDLYTVSKLLGHRNISTTQIYAKIIDKTKQDAVKRIPKLL